MKKHSRKILRIVSDLHIGNLEAIWPEKLVVKGQDYPPGRVGQWLMDEWKRQWAELPRPDFVVLNGDILDGPNVKSLGSGTHTPTADIQVLAALDVLKPIRRMVKHLWIIHGTKYHEERYGALAEGLEATINENGERHGIFLNLEIDGHVVNFSHHPEYGGMGGSALQKITDDSIIGAALHKVPSAGVVVRSHLHKHNVLRHHDRIGILTPCYTFASEYAQGKYYKWQPDLGLVDLIFEGNGAMPVVASREIEFPEFTRRVTVIKPDGRLAVETR